MAKTFQPYEPEQSLLFPPSPRDWLPEGHLAYFVMDVVRELDLADIKGHYEKELRGYPPYHPQMMTALLLYGYCSGVASSRKIERKTYEDVAFRVIAAGHHPDHTAISEFRRIHLEALSGLFVQVLQLCRKAGLVKLGHVALDGTKVKANASKHKAMSYERMKEKERELKTKVKALLEAAKNEDAYEDQKYGVSRRGDELPEELQRAKSRLAKIRAAKRALEEEAAQGPDDGEGGSGTSLPNHRVPATKEGKPAPKAQRNFTDAESRIQKSGDGGRGLFLRGQRARGAGDGHGPAHRDRAPETRRAGAEGAGPHAVEPDDQRANGPQAAYAQRPRDLREEEVGRGAGVWTDQSYAEPPPAVAARPAQGAGRVGHDLAHPQPAQAARCPRLNERGTPATAARPPNTDTGRRSKRDSARTHCRPACIATAPRPNISKAQHAPSRRSKVCSLRGRA